MIESFELLKFELARVYCKLKKNLSNQLAVQETSSLQARNANTRNNVSTDRNITVNTSSYIQ